MITESVSFIFEETLLVPTESLTEGLMHSDSLRKVRLSTDKGHLYDTIKSCQIPLIDFMQLDYSRNSVLGVGGNAVVWKGTYHDKDVAIKESKQEKISVTAVKAWLREALLSSRFKNENILKFYGVCVAPPDLLMVYEWCNERDLGAYLEKDDLPFDDQLNLAYQAVKGLAFFHKQGLIHRDIKPQNYLIHIDEDGNLVVKLADYGSCRSQFDEMPIFTGISPVFAAPEIRQYLPSPGEQLTKDLMQQTIHYSTEIDVFSLGWVLWAIFYGKQWKSELRPRYGDMIMGWTPGLHEIAPDIAKIVADCWDWRPNLRPTIREIRKSLEYLQPAGYPRNPKQIFLEVQNHYSK